MFWVITIPGLCLIMFFANRLYGRPEPFKMVFATQMSREEVIECMKLYNVTNCLKQTLTETGEENRYLLSLCEELRPRQEIRAEMYIERRAEGTVITLSHFAGLPSKPGRRAKPAQMIEKFMWQKLKARRIRLLDEEE